MCSEAKMVERLRAGAQMADVISDLLNMRSHFMLSPMEEDLYDRAKDALVNWQNAHRIQRATAD